jgi:hypothetical protein
MVALPSIERTPDGRRLVVDRVVDADAEAVWTVLTDTAYWPEWGPSVSAVRSDDRDIESGTTGEIQVAGGRWISFEIPLLASGYAVVCRLALDNIERLAERGGEVSRR